MNKKFLPLLFLVIPILIPIFFLPMTACVAPDRSTPQSLFDQARRDMAAGRHAKAASEFRALINMGRGKIPAEMLARAYKYRGDCNAGLKKYALARLDYSDASRIVEARGSALAGGAALAAECVIARGDTYLHEKDYRIADKIFADLLAKPPPAKYRDPLLYRRYICALKLGLPHPERFTDRIGDLNGFDVVRLGREFLGHNGPLLTLSPPLEHETPLHGDSVVRIIPRSAWHAAHTRSNVDPMTAIRRITIHHSGSVWTSTDYKETAERIRYYQKFHQDDKGWADIGYHFIIDRYGRIWEGRDLRFQGAHAGNPSLNRGNIGICVMGDYDVQELNDRQKESLVALVSLLSREYGLRPWQIVTHRELKSTACPGKNLQNFVEALRRGYAP